MKFYGEPNLLVRLIPSIGNMEFFKFDEKGEYDTENPRLIKRLKTRFRYDEEKQYKCKKCGYQTNNKGELLAHYRHEH